MKKYLYLLLGLAVLTLAGIISYWFLDEIPYFATSELAKIRIGIAILAWVVGIIYLYYGIKSEKINRLSDISAIVLILTPVVYILLSFFTCFAFTGCPPYGPPCINSCPEYSMIINRIFGILPILGCGTASILCVSSLFVRNKKLQNK